MKTVKLIEGLVTKDVPINVNDPAYHKYYTLTSDGELLAAEVKEYVVPVTYFGYQGNPGIYIAYSQEVEDLLGIPIGILAEENKRLKVDLYEKRREAYETTLALEELKLEVKRFNNLPWWKRIWYKKARI